MATEKKAKTTKDTSKKDVVANEVPVKKEKVDKAEKAAARKAEKAAKKDAKKTPAAAKAVAGVNDYATIVRPIITEKSSQLGGNGNILVLEVGMDASKVDIKGAVERVFNVQVASVRTCNYLGKTKRGTRGMTRRAGYRKAYVTLREGQTVNIVEGL